MKTAAHRVLGVMLVLLVLMPLAVAGGGCHCGGRWDTL